MGRYTLLTRKHNDDLRERSGNVTSDDPLTSFLYTLMRDHCVPGDIENLVRDIEDEQGSTAVFTIGWLAKYAKDLSERIRICEPDPSREPELS